MTATSEQVVPLNRIIYQFSPSYVGVLITQTLQGRSEMSTSARDSLNSAIRDGVRVDRFRDASKADPAQLVPHVLDAFQDGDDRLVGAVLRGWVELRKDLHDVVVEHLDRRGLLAPGPNLRERCFDEIWPVVEWAREIESVLESNGDLDEEDVGMMLSFASGRVPDGDESENKVSSPLLSDWLDGLAELPPEAAEWEEISRFIHVVEDIAAAKDVERVLKISEEFVDTLTAVEREYEAELTYLEIDLRNWREDAVRRPGCLPRATNLAKSLDTSLAEYRKIRPQADSRKEELERAADRAKRETALLDIVAEWARLKGEFDAAEADSYPDGGVGPHDAEAAGPDTGGPGAGDPQSGAAPAPVADGGTGQDASRSTLARGESEDLRSELDRVRRDAGSLHSDNDSLRRINRDLETDRQSLSGENSGLRDELALSRSLEESWRRAYVDSRVARVEDEGEPPPANVGEALARAQKVFPDQLLLAPNSKSDKNSAFLKPDEVFDALAWLATDYHRLRSDPPGKPPPFDRLLKASCPGWSYKPHQAAVTRERFDDWYRTEVNGRSHDLSAHLGKGTDRDPQTTIRIAFAWDDEQDKVIVGFIGLHQRNRLG